MSLPGPISEYVKYWSTSNAGPLSVQDNASNGLDHTKQSTGQRQVLNNTNYWTMQITGQREVLDHDQEYARLQCFELVLSVHTRVVR